MIAVIFEAKLAATQQFPLLCSISCFLPAVITDRHLYEGDIVLTPEQREDMEATANPNDIDSPSESSVATSTHVVEERTNTIPLGRKPRCSKVLRPA